MATVKAIKYGMKGDDVSNLQTALKNAGYKIDVDGSFGSQTLAAVKDYQQKNGLDVDGMVGPQTQAKLFGNTSTPTNTSAGTNTGAVTGGAGSAASAATNVNYPDPPTYDQYEAPERVVSDNVNKAQAALDAVLAAQPGAYQSKWQGQIDEIIGRILNREAFSYDFNEDALYKQYAEQYMRGGKLAMQDTMGQAAAMTGGYGNSYASTAGNQAYQEYLSQLNAVIPELYGMALDRYQMEGQEMYNQYGLLSEQEAQDYGRYMDEYNKWVGERDYHRGVYDTEEDRDFNRYMNSVDLGYRTHTDKENRKWDEYVTAVGNAQWAENMAFNEEQAAIDNAYRDKVFDADEEQRGIDNQHWETSRNDNLNSEAKANARDEVMTILQSGGTVSDAQLAAAGISKETATALSNAYQKTASGNGGSSSGSGKADEDTSYVTDSDKIGKWSDAILEADTEEEAMRYAERLEQLDPDLAYSLYEEWLKEHGGDKSVTDTTVVKGQPKYTGGGGGKIMVKY